MDIPEPHEMKMQEARTLIAQGERAQALAILYSLVAVTPNHRDAWWLITTTTPHSHQRRNALQRVLQIDPAFQPALDYAARLQGQEPRPSAAATQIHMTPPEVPPQPTASPPAAQGYAPSDPAQPAYPPQQQAYPPPQQQAYPPPQERTPDYPLRQDYPPPQQSYPPAPVQYPVQRVERYPPPSEPDEPEVVYVKRSGRLQPFLVVNGGCTSGCFSLVLTLVAIAVLAFLLVGDSVSQALREVNMLGPDENAAASLIPAIALTAVLGFLQTSPISLPFNLGTLIAGTGVALPESSELFAGALRTLWSSLGYPVQTGDAIMRQFATVGPQLSAANWIAVAVFLGGWVLLAFWFVFLRARSNRLLHWFLSTFGLWFLTGAAVLVGMLLYRVVSGA